MAVAADRELGMVTPLCLSLGLQELLFYKVQGCCWKSCSWALKGGCCQLGVGVRLSCLFYLKTQSDGNHSWSLTKSLWVWSQWPAGQRLWGLLSPWRIEAIEHQVHLAVCDCCFGIQVCSSWVSLYCHTSAFHWFLRLTKWDGNQQSLQLVVHQSRFFPPSPSSQIVVACVKLYLMVDELIASCSPSRRSSREIQAMDPWHSLPAFFLCSSHLWTCDFVPWGSTLVIPCSRAEGKWGQICIWFNFLAGWCDVMSSRCCVHTAASSSSSKITLFPREVALYFSYGLLVFVHY